MSDTETRPTPEEVVGPLEFTPGSVVEHLARHGYRIVHPDDVVAFELDGRELATEEAYLHGWNACRAHIFGGDDE
jgi:Mn-dependent DtxR family transcriptional regulator